MTAQLAENNLRTSLSRLRAAVENVRSRGGVSMFRDYPEINVEILVDRMRAQIEAERLGQAQLQWPAIRVPAFDPAVATLPRFSIASEPIPLRDSYTLDELLAGNDEVFVRNAYRALLRREPDPVGMHHFLSRLVAGDAPKVEILGAIRASPEGRAAGVRVPGLRLAYVLRRLMRVPVLGSLLAMIVYAPRLSAIVTGIERREAHTHRREQALRSAIDALAAAVEVTNARFAEQARSSVAELVEALGRLDREKMPRLLGDALGQQVSSLRGEIVKLGAEMVESASHSEVLDLATAALSTAAQLEAGLAALDASKADAAQVDREVARLGVERNADMAQTAHQIKELRRRAEEDARKAAADVERLRTERESDVAETERKLTELRQHAEEGVHQASAMLQGVENRFDQELGRIVERIGPVETRLEYLGTHVGKLFQGLTGVDARIDQLAVDLSHKAALSEVLARHAQAVELQRSASDRTDASIQRIEAELARYHQGLKQLGAVDTAGESDLERYYTLFEDRFRGTRDEIKGRVAVYLPLVRAVDAGTTGSPVLDIGCGRGEWLEILREAGLQARGIDLNADMVKRCRAHGLDAAQADLFEYLAALPEASLGAVSAMHVIEHIPFSAVMLMYSQVLRALRPGGVAIFETPNPENLLVGACNFWSDPTHLRPMPPEATRFAVESRGFERTEILRLHPYPAASLVKTGTEEVRHTLNSFLYGSQDYAIIAYKPVIVP